MENMFDDISKDLSRIGIDINMPIVHAIFVQDHSGSMDIKTDSGQKRAELATSNFNEQLAKIKRESDEVITTVTVIEFDDRILCNEHFIHQIRDNNIETRPITFSADEVKPMTNWWTGGATALRDDFNIKKGWLRGILSAERMMDKFVGFNRHPGGMDA